MALRVRSPIDIAISGLEAEGMRMNVISNNIANANTCKTPFREAYRRQDVILQSADGEGLGGVSISEVISDASRDFQRVYNPGHKYADGEGMVTMSNVQVPHEMMQMILASRSYQANAAAMKKYQDMMEVTTDLIR